MSINPIDGVGSKSIPPAGADNGDTPAPPPSKPVIKPPLERPFSLSLPPEPNPAQSVVDNINASNEETEKNTAKSAKEDQLKKLLEEQRAQDQLLNGPGVDGV
jgi:hypothetical protein